MHDKLYYKKLNETLVSKQEGKIDLLIFFIVMILYLVADFYNIKKIYIISGLIFSILMFGLLIIYRNKETFENFGLRLDNICYSFIPILFTTIIASIIILLISYYLNRECNMIIFDKNFLILFILYSFYGMLQQLAIQGILHRRFQLFFSIELSILFTALVFGFIHIKLPILYFLTFFGGLVWSKIFSDNPNIILLGISQGFLGGLMNRVIFDKI